MSIRINPILILLVALSGFGGIAVGSTITSFAQNGTATVNDPLVVSLDKLIYVAIVPITISVLGLIRDEIKRRGIKGMAADALVMAADGSVAISKTRDQFNRFSQNTVEVVGIASPETRQAANEKLAPIVDDIADKALEYKPKSDVFVDIARAGTKSGERNTTEMKEVSDKIPDEIMPTKEEAKDNPS